MNQITYNEYLPITLGYMNMKDYGLLLLRRGFYKDYDPSVRPDILNSLATAAFRYGHSQIGNTLPMASQDFKRRHSSEFSEVLRQPELVYETHQVGGSGTDSVMLGLISEPAKDVDAHFSKEMTVELFSKPGIQGEPRKPNLDLVSLNIMRGRDHGLPGQ